MSRRLPSLNALRAFEAAARHSSFTAAAEELHVTHASISRHVRDLEAWLNVKLFRRLSRGVVLTEPGEGYSRRLTPLFDELNAATQAVMQPKASGELVVSVETAFAARWLVGRLGRFQARPIRRSTSPSIRMTSGSTSAPTRRNWPFVSGKATGPMSRSWS